VVQLKWRLAEGDGEAIYELGVEDNGFMYGLNEEQLSTSLDTLVCFVHLRWISALSLVRPRLWSDGLLEFPVECVVWSVEFVALVVGCSSFGWLATWLEFLLPLLWLVMLCGALLTATSSPR
jgi:hypothetical protein